VGWAYQPVGVRREAMAPLADLGLGVLDERGRRGLARQLCKGCSRRIGRRFWRAMWGSGPRGCHICERADDLQASGYPRGYIGTMCLVGTLLLAPWDGTGEVAADSAYCYPALAG